MSSSPVDRYYGWARYLTSNEYAPAFCAQTGEVYSEEGWLYALLHLCPREQLIAAIVAAARVAQAPGPDLDAWRTYVMQNVDPRLGGLMTQAMADQSGPRLLFLARQPLLLALRLALIEPERQQPGSGDPRIVATMLAHHAAAGDSSDRSARAPEPLLGGRPESQTMSLVANALFNSPLDYGGLIARTHFLWTAYEQDIVRYPPRRPLHEMVRDATGLDLDDILALAFAIFAHAETVAVESDAVALDLAKLGLPRATVDRFLELFSSDAVGFAGDLQKSARTNEWFFLPFESRPLLRVGPTEAMVIDVVLLQRRFTHALYWLVHDHEKRVHGESARNRWTQTYSELVELHAEHLLRSQAPASLSGAETFFTEEQVGKLGGSAADCGIDFGDFVVVADIVQHQVTVPSRAYADARTFRRDIAMSVVGKARQLSQTIDKLLTETENPAHPIGRRPARIIPMVVEGADFPVIMETTTFIADELRSASLLQQDECSRLLVVTLGELEMLTSLVHSGHVPSADIAFRSYATDPAGDSFTNHLLRNYNPGGPVQRPPFMQQAQMTALNAVLSRVKTID